MADDTSASSLSTGLNSMAAVVLEDFIKPNRKTPISDKATMYVLKGVVVIFGVLCVGLVFIVEKLGTVLQLSMTLSSVTSGPALGIFLSGLLVPIINEKGALWGGVVGLCSSSIVVFGNQQAQTSGALTFPVKPTFVDNCPYTFEQTVLPFNATAAEEAASEIFILYRLGFLWNTMFGTIVTLILATVISYATGCNEKINPDFFSPPIRKWLPVRRKSKLTQPQEKELLGVLIKEEKIYKFNNGGVRTD